MPMLQLEKYYYPNIVIKADPDYKLGKKPKSATKLNVENQIRQVSVEKRTWEVILKLKGTPEKDPIPYHFDLEVIGIFTVAPEFPEKEMEKLVQIAGASMLYSATREFVLMVTSRGPFPPITLPTISFQKGIKTSKKGKDSAKASEVEAEKNP